MTAVEAENLTSAYGRRKILQGVNFYAERGECVGIVGKNGCGKSTLLSILAGTLKAKSGSVKFFGSEALHSPSVIRKMTGYVPQENPLMPDLSVYDNLRLWYRHKEELDFDLREGTLHLLGIDGFVKMPVEKLSGGMKKRVSMGIALVGMPPVLILDEPGAALDLVCKEDIRAYLRQYLERKGTVLIATHEDGELALCDRIYVMREGVLTEVDNTLRGKELTEHF